MSPTPDLAEVVRRFGPGVRARQRLSAAQDRVLRAVEACRTPALGGHRYRCASCGHEHATYHSCRNRHCPKCQSLAKARWLAARQAELLPVGTFHAVFTLPHELNGLLAANPRPLLGQLFTSVAATLQSFAKHELDGTLGILAILHTWDQQLRRHVHLHCLIPAGALASEPERWVSSAPEFLFRVEPLGVKFRGHFLAALRTLHAQGNLVVPPRAAGPAGFGTLLDTLYAKTWLPYLKPPLAGPRQVLDYLGRYTHRVAISNERIRAIDGDEVLFSYRDRADGNSVKLCRLPGERFLGRYLQHVVPDGFRRVRHYGLWANRSKRAALARCRVLLGAEPSQTKAAPKTTRQWILDLTGVDIACCPACHAPTWHRVAVLPPIRAPPSPRLLTPASL